MFYVKIKQKSKGIMIKRLVYIADSLEDAIDYVTRRGNKDTVYYIYDSRYEVVKVYVKE